MKLPPAEIRDALVSAALRWRVPYTVLAAIAFKESSYNARAKGAKDEIGLMQLRPSIAKRYNVRNPLDAQQSALGAAEFIARLCKALHWEWSTVFAAYNAGPTVSAHGWTPAVVAYSRQVWSNRIWLQNEAKPAGDSPTESLMLAIKQLAAMNTQDAAAQALLSRWQQQTKDGVPAAPVSRWSLGRSFVAEYASVYDRAVLTDGRTPPPWLLAPDLWAEGKKRARDWAGKLGALLPNLGGPSLGALVLVGGGAYFLLQRKKTGARAQ